MFVESVHHKFLPVHHGWAMTEPVFRNAVVVFVTVSVPVYIGVLGVQVLHTRLAYTFGIHIWHIRLAYTVYTRVLAASHIRRPL